jgi:hypothetical protein
VFKCGDARRSMVIITLTVLVLRQYNTNEKTNRLALYTQGSIIPRQIHVHYKHIRTHISRNNARNNYKYTTYYTDILKHKAQSLVIIRQVLKLLSRSHYLHMRCLFGLCICGNDFGCWNARNTCTCVLQTTTYIWNDKVHSHVKILQESKQLSRLPNQHQMSVYSDKLFFCLTWL